MQNRVSGSATSARSIGSRGATARRFLFVVAVLALGGLLAGDVHARGRGGGRGGVSAGGTGGRSGGRGGRGGSGGVGRGRSVRFIIKRRTGGSGDGAKEWQVLLQQEERKAQITERRDALMDGDRKGEQESHLETERGRAADAAGRASIIK